MLARRFSTRRSTSSAAPATASSPSRPTSGACRAQVSSATDRVKAQQAIVEDRIGTLEGVDPAEAKVKIDTLTTQIEMSYSLTAKLLQISILNYA